MADNASQQAWKTAVTDSSTTAQEELGAIRYDRTSTGLKGYKYVQNIDTSALANGDCVHYDSTTPATAYYKVDMIGTADLPAAAGIAVGAIAANSYGWIQVYGYHAAAKIKGDTDATTVNLYVGQSGTAGKLGGATSAFFGTSIGLTSVSTDTTGPVFLKGLI